ncbi:MAG TPA: M28 family peptidase, partial [Gemmatimonadales bacterium]|nr:M28 family peptidase [Gemmatimonadales bacterium]
MRTGSAGALALTVMSASAAVAQSTAVTKAAATITELDVHRRISIIADDSMGGRNTPSPGLDKAARYIASEFQRLGLKPGGDSGSYLLRYPISSRRLLAAQSAVRFGQISGDRGVRTSLTDGARLISGPTEGTIKGGVVLVSGAAEPDSIKLDDVRGRIIVYVPTGADPSGGFRMLRALGRSGARGVVVVVGSDSAVTEYQSTQDRIRTVAGDLGRGVPVIAIKESAVVAQLPEAAQQFEHLRTMPMTVTQPMLDWEGEIALQDSTESTGYAPDVVGILEGSDPVLKNEYLVYSAHMDHIGTTGAPGAACRALAADSICNGADDDGSGTVGVLELAEAYSQKGARPRRSVIFLTVSGEEHGLWGSAWFVNHPPVPLPQIVADLNADMIGRNWKDTIVAIGKEHSDLGV